jgi:DNA-binding transcriptional ArsR family regulator
MGVPQSCIASLLEHEVATWHGVVQRTEPERVANAALIAGEFQKIANEISFCLDKNFFPLYKRTMESSPKLQSSAVLPVMVVRDREQLSTLLAGGRARMLEVLQAPQSAAGLARKTGMKRQQVNYHLRELEKAGLVELVEERKRGNCVERVLRATARSYVISPEVLGRLGVPPKSLSDRFSPAYLIAQCCRAIREVGRLGAEVTAGGERLPTLTLENELRFASDAVRDDFARELSDALARLILEYHDCEASGGESYKVILGAYLSAAEQAFTEERR